MLLFSLILLSFVIARISWLSSFIACDVFILRSRFVGVYYTSVPAQGSGRYRNQSKRAAYTSYHTLRTSNRFTRIGTCGWIGPLERRILAEPFNVKIAHGRFGKVRVLYIRLFKRCARQDGILKDCTLDRRATKAGAINNAIGEVGSIHIAICTAASSKQQAAAAAAAEGESRYVV
jgi:hypothetical protein